MSRWTRTGLVVGLAGSLVVGGTTAVLLSSGGTTTAATVPSVPVAPLPTPQAVLPAATGDVVPWDKPLTVTAKQGTLLDVSVVGPQGVALAGSLAPAGWTSLTTLVPATTYSLTITLLDKAGDRRVVERMLTTTKATTVRPTVAPSSGVYGIGQPVIVRFNRPVKSPEARRAVVGRLQVTTTPYVPGAWRWFNSYEVHYRGATYWKPGTTITTVADLSGLAIPGTKQWGAAKVSKGTMTIGDAMVSIVDVTAHTMTVKRNGKVVRVMKVSTGREEYPTKGGAHIVLRREKVHLFNSATIGIPTDSPDGYYRKLPWSVRISNGGAFVHTNNSTIRYQGRVNVSHGCVNLRESDARWFYYNSRLGDVVDVIHAAVGPNRFDAGMADWNYSWAKWQQGNYGD